jgi:5-methylcytosine-specific restriction enzyme A
VRRFCLEPRCSVLVERGEQYCPTHLAERAQRDAERRGTPAERGYDAAEQALARAFARAHPFCEWHLAKGVRVPTAIVDHRVPLSAGGPRLDPRNLQALCRSCHGVKTAREQRRAGGSVSFRPPPANTAAKPASIAPENARDLREEFFFK